MDEREGRATGARPLALPSLRADTSHDFGLDSPHRSWDLSKRRLIAAVCPPRWGAVTPSVARGRDPSRPTRSPAPSRSRAA